MSFGFFDSFFQRQKKNSLPTAPSSHIKEIKKQDPIKVTVQELGYVVYKLSRSRSEEMYHIFIDENKFDIHGGLLQIYTCLFNLSLSEIKLFEKYPSNTIEAIMDTAYQLFFKTIIENYSNELLSEIRPDIPIITLDIHEAFNEAKEIDDTYSNPYRTLAKRFLWYCTGEDTFDESIIFETTLEITGWIRFSDFLLTDYVLI